MQKFILLIKGAMLFILSSFALSETAYYEYAKVEMLLASKDSLSVLVSDQCEGCTNKVYKVDKYAVLKDADGTLLEVKPETFKSKKIFYANIKIKDDVLQKMRICIYIK